MRAPAAVLYLAAILLLLFTSSCGHHDPNLHPDHVVQVVSTDEIVYVLSPTPAGTRLYVSCDVPSEGSARMMILRSSNYATIGSFPCGKLPMGMLFLPNGRYLYVADDPYLESMGKVWAVDVAKSQVVKEIPTGRDPVPLAATPDSRFLYVGSWLSSKVLVVRTEDNVVVDTIGFPYSADAVAVSPDGLHLYVSAGKIYVLRTSDHAVVDSIDVGGRTGKLAILPDGRRLYASTVDDSGLVYAVSLPGNTVDDSVFIGRRVDEVCALAGGRFVYTSGPFDSLVGVIRTSDDSVVERIPVGFSPMGLAAHPDGSRVYVVGYHRREFVVLGI